MFQWNLYINKTKNKPPRKLLVKALDFVDNKETALDLGAGAMNDTKFMIEAGFRKIVAIDSEKDDEIMKDLDKDIVSFDGCKIEDYNFPANAFDLINAQFILPFVKKGETGMVISGIKKSLKYGGIFAGQFFGTRDSWKNNPEISFYTEEEVRNFLDGMEIIYFQEEEKDDGAMFEKKKHWHIFHFIARA